MKTRKVVHGKNLTMRCPLVATLVFWLVLDRLDAAGWVWGAVGVVLVIGWIAWIVDLLNVDQVDVFDSSGR